MNAVIAILVLVMLAPIAAAGSQAPPIARVVAEREASLRKRIASAPADPQAYLDLARLQRDLGVDADAVATLLQARKTLPTNNDVLLQLAYLYSSKQFEKAMELLSISAKLDPADPERQHIITTFYEDKIYHDKSLGPAQRATYIREGIAAADRALAIKPDYMESFVYKGILLKARAEFATDPAEKTRIMAEAEALQNRAKELREKKAATPNPPPSSTTAAPATFAPPPPLPPPPPEGCAY